MKNVKGSVVALVGLVLMVVTLAASAATEKQQAEIKERIKPAGHLCLEGDDSCGSVVAAGGGPQSPEDIYNANCVACHAAGVAGAPMIGDTAAWEARAAKGIEVLYSSALNGLNSIMPARGLCMSCTDDEVKATVDYMLELSK